MVIQRSRTLFISSLCAIALGMSCSRADTRFVALGTPLEPIAEVEPPEVGASDDSIGNLDPAVAGNAGPMPVLNELLTTQALLISLLLAPVAKDPHELAPVEGEPALPDSKTGGATATSPTAAPSVQERFSDIEPLPAPG